MWKLSPPVKAVEAEITHLKAAAYALAEAKKGVERPEQEPGTSAQSA